MRILSIREYDNGVKVYHVLIPSASEPIDRSVILVVKDGVLVKATCDCPYNSIKAGLCSHIRLACARLNVKIPKEFYIYGKIVYRRSCQSVKSG